MKNATALSLDSLRFLVLSGMLLLLAVFATSSALAQPADCPTYYTQIAKFEVQGGSFVPEGDAAGISITITATKTNGEPLEGTFTSSTTPVAAAYVKSGSHGNTIYYDPAIVGSDKEGSFDNDGVQQAISHVTFCQTEFHLPVELVGFEAQVDGRNATLSWQTASETNNAGFEVQHSYLGTAHKTSAARYETLGFVEGHGTTLEAQAYAFPVSTLEPGRHLFRLKQVDYDGSFEYSPEVELSVEMPDVFIVSPVYPNPFNPQASFSFGVKQAQRVRVEVYNLLGQRVLALYDGVVEAGLTRTLTIDGSRLQSGTYLLRVQGERFVETQSVMLVK